MAADIPDLSRLLQERHFGIAACGLDPAPVDEVLRRWQRRLNADLPRTWGEALGTSIHELRWLLRDNHLAAAGEDTDLLRGVDPRAHEPRTEREPGPVVDDHVIDGVLCLRLRQCGGISPAATERASAWQHAHGRHFDHLRIVVDLRAKPGGSDEYVIGWIRDHVRRDVVWPTWREWRIGERASNAWNVAVYYEAVHGTGALAARLNRDEYRLVAASSLRINDDPFMIPAAPTAWTGRMLVVTDRGSASAAESAAWMLRTGLDAKIIGGRSVGAVGFGNMAPYLLPRSGLKIDLPAASSGWVEESMAGMPVDLDYDIHTPLDAIAHKFDAIYEAATR